MRPRVASRGLNRAPIATRRKAREEALQALFQAHFNAEARSSLLTETGAAHLNFSQQLVSGALQHQSDIDKTIEKYVQHWSTERITAMDHTILRIAIFEMIFLKETPPNVVIDEAIEIAKKYGSENSGAFVNGVLDAIRRAEIPS